MNTNTTTKPGEMPELPTGMDRRGEKKPATPQVPAIPGTAPLGVKPPSATEPRKAFRSGRVLPSLKPTPKPEAKTPKAKGAAKRDTKGKAHKPTEMVRTDANPAKSIVPPSFKERYAAHDDSNGDKVALALKAFVAGVNDEGRPSTDLAKLKQVADDNGVDFKRYASLNVGQQRMNVGNRLRGILKAGKAVTIGKQRFANAETALKVQEPKAKPEKTAKAA